jgi:nucleotide-binding universal stress UspA family protein
VIVGQAESGSPHFAFATDLLTTVVLSSGRPLLLIPYIGARDTLGENVLIAWDGSKEATRAVADAMPFLESARHVRVVAVNRERNGDPGSDAASASARLAAWLAGHGVNAEISCDDIADVGIADWLLSRAADSDCDLIVMGGYGHARVREVVLGGVTRSMLHSMTVPLLMSH